MLGFRDLAGQAEPVRRLLAALDSGRVHHGLLFLGPEGVGKFAAAKALARALFCPVDPSGCGRCESCGKVETGHADLQVVETTEKMLKVDDIRGATAQLHVRPIEAPGKVLIVRDAEKLNPQAQNALLKTLEEPPGGSRLILTCSRPEVLLVTVVSRCQSVHFPPVPVAALAELLVRQGLAPATAHLVAALSEGSPGRAQKMEVEALLEQRDEIADLDARLERGSSASVAMAAAAALVEADTGLRARLDLLRVWTRDQMVTALGLEAEVANRDRAEQLAGLAEARGLREILRRAETIEFVRRQLDSPYNLNALLLMEELCLALGAHVVLRATGS